MRKTTVQPKRTLFRFCFLVKNFLAAERAVLVLLKLAGYVLAVLRRRVILALALRTLKSDYVNCRLLLATHFISFSYIL